MNVYMVTRKIDSMGRVGIPQEIREELEFNIGDALFFEKTENGIILRKMEKFEGEKISNE